MNFISNDSDEIKKEQEKNAALHSLFPLTMGSSEDKTNYYLVDDGKHDKENFLKKNKRQLNDVYNVANSLKKLNCLSLKRLRNQRNLLNYTTGPAEQIDM
jgi:hypothetical protein